MLTDTKGILDKTEISAWVFPQVQQMPRSKSALIFVVLTAAHPLRAEVLTLSQAVGILGQYIAFEAMALAAASECRAVPAGQWQGRRDSGNTLIWAGPDDFRSLTEQAARYRAVHQNVFERVFSTFPQVGHEIEEGLRRNGGVERMTERFRMEAQSERDRLGELGWCAAQKASIDYMDFNVLRPISGSLNIVPD